jgi:hypothetical protein
MKQGAYLDDTEPYQPWLIIMLTFVMNNINKEEVEGSFQPLNMGIGWDEDVLDSRRCESNSGNEA